MKWLTFSNETKPILLSYLTLYLYKVLPILIPLSLLGYTVPAIIVLRYLLVSYLYLNLFLNDCILRESVKIRTVHTKEHNCSRCSQNVIWNLQDQLANLLFLIIGSVFFKANIYLDLYWRSFIHSIPLATKNKLCIQKSIQIEWFGILFGLLNYVCEWALTQLFPFEYVLFSMLWIQFAIDCFIFDRTLPSYPILPMQLLLIFGWKTAQCLMLGIIEIKKRSIGQNNMISEWIRVISYMKNSTFYRFILWKEFQTLDNFISYGSTSAFYREHILNMFELLLNIKYFLTDNKAIIFARKTKLLHITTIFKPYMSAENKFYITLFEARKEIEPFIKEIIAELERSIQTTKCVLDYEELYSYDTQLNHSMHMMESHYKVK